VRRAAAMDIGDWFRLETGALRSAADTGGVRLPATAFVGNTRWSALHVDLVGTGLRMTGQPENVPPLARIAMPTSGSTGTGPTRLSITQPSTARGSSA
jgi:hypothetical protein